MRVVFKTMLIHPPVKIAHLAGCAAAKQGKFNEFKHEWWEKAFKTRKMDQENIEAIAKGIGLDVAKLKADMESDECKQLVDGDIAELGKWHVNSTPSFFINGKHFAWNGDPAGFKQALDENVKAVEASGVPCADYYEKEVMGKGEKQFRSKMDAKK